MPTAQSADSLSGFAEAHGLSYTKAASLPEQGDVLTRGGGKVEGAAEGTLPGDLKGTLAHFTYTYTYTDSDNNTHHEVRRFTLVVTSIPESIGFLPYMGFSGPGSKLSATAGGEDMAKIDMDKSEVLKHASAYAYKGTRESWLAQLLSPAMVQWLERCDEDFGFELANGVLVVGRDGYRSSETDLTALCEDAAHLAGAIREESLEEVETSGEAEAAKDPDAADVRMEAALADVEVGSPPNTAAAIGAFRSHALRSPGTYLRALRSGILWTLILNVPGVAVPIVLSVNGLLGPLAVIEATLVVLITVFSFRGRVRDYGKKDAAEAFYRAYAADRKLRIEEPLRFAAGHAEAKLPFKPDRVFSGPLPGGIEGALALSGDGSKRSDRIAVVAGPRGPYAEAELQAEAPGLSAATLDGYAERLVKEVQEDIATRPG